MLNTFLYIDKIELNFYLIDIFSVRSGQIRNIHSAKVSVPGQIKKLVSS